MNNEKDHIRAVEQAPKTTGANHSPAPTLVTQIKDNTLSILLSYMDQLFSSCDDLFFDLSSRAANNNEQNLYFESMRELRIKKNGIITNYRQQIEQLFSDCSKPQFSPDSHLDHKPDESLSLVQHDEIEQDVAINSMTNKARINNQEALYQLATRLDYLINTTKIDQDNNPIDPQQLCKSFANASEMLDINIKAKIILFKQFDRLVINKLANLYSNANDLLVNAGVVPQISRGIKKTAQPQGKDQTKASKSQSASYEQSAIQFDELSNLLATLRALDIQQLPSYQPYSTNPGPVMSNQELLAAITLLQSEFNAANDESYIHQLIASVLSQTNPEAPAAVKQSDEDIINLVAMFFDFVLDDRNLPVAVQAIIGRLQIPILKVALKDQSFFNNSNHPARKLVNRLAEISIGLEDSASIKEDRTYQVIASIVHDVQEQFSINLEVFDAKLQDLEKFADRDIHRSELIEKRTTQAEEGRAKTDEARKATHNLLLDKLLNTLLPSGVMDFLVNHWQQLMVLTHLKYGEDSQEWLDAVQLVQDLIWACQPHQDEKSQKRLLRVHEHLMQRIDSGLKAITITDQQAKEISALISSAVLRCQEEDNRHITEPLNPKQAQALGHTPGAGSKSWKEMSALERQQARHKKLTYEYIKKAEETPLNTWLAYKDINSGQTLRCKLSAKIESSDLYVFVNRLGFKALKKTRKDFAYDMQNGRAKILLNEPLFDRTMSRIRNKLTQTATPSPSDQ